MIMKGCCTGTKRFPPPAGLVPGTARSPCENNACAETNGEDPDQSDLDIGCLLLYFLLQY